MIHQKIQNKLGNILKDNNIMNVCFYGKNGSGKYTLARYYIEKYYNNQCNIEENTFKYENKEFIYYYSKNHYEIVFNTYNSNDFLLIKAFLDNIINKNTIIFSDKKKIILIKNSHLLKNNVLNLIRQYIEKYYSFNIFILISNNFLNKKYSGFFCFIRVPQAENEDLKLLCKQICKDRNIKIKKDEIEEITKLSNRNMKYLIHLIDYSFINDKYEKYEDPINDKLKFLYKIIKKKNISSLIIIRDLLNELIIENINLQSILIYLLNKYKKEYSSNKINFSKLIQILNILKDYSYKISIGLRPLILLEACILEIMDIL